MEVTMKVYNCLQVLKWRYGYEYTVTSDHVSIWDRAYKKVKVRLHKVKHSEVPQFLKTFFESLETNKVKFMSQVEVKKAALKVITDYLAKNGFISTEEEVTEEKHLSDDLGLDSLDVVELAMEYEKEFSIVVPDEVAENAKTVGDLINLICIEVEKKGAADGTGSTVNF